jgi:hypothetical protein
LRGRSANIDAEPYELKWLAEGGGVALRGLLMDYGGARTAGAVVVHHTDAAATVDELCVLFGLPVTP